jgi:hypothetical protein
MVLQKYRAQLSDKAISLEHGSKIFFVPSSFEHKHIDKDFVDIEFPQWFLKQHGQAIKEMEVNTNLLIKRLCDQG